MKKIALWLMLIITAFAFTACGGDSEASYTLELADMPDCYVGDTVELPNATVKTSDGASVEATVTYTVTDPTGTEVNVTENAFTASVLGEYTVKASANGATAEKKFSVTRRKMNAVSDLSVNASGVITFTQKEGETYTLYRGDTSLGAVQSGANVLDKLVDGNNIFTVVTDAKGDYDASNKSNEATLEKLAKVTDLSVNDDFDVLFTESDGVTYTFVFNGSEDGVELNSGDNILQYLHLGQNSVTVKPSKFGAVAGETSESLTVNVNNYLPVSDLRIEDGKVLFTQEQERTYTLYINGEGKSAVTSNAAIEDYLTAENQLETVNVQVQVDGDDSYGASRLGNVATYFYNLGNLGRVVYDGSNRITDTMGRITDVSNMEEGEGDDKIEFMRFVTTPVDGSARYASVKFETPLAVTDSEAVNYLRVVMRNCPDSEILDQGEWFGVTRGSVGVYDQNLVAHMYDHNYRGKVGTSESKWFAVEIQLTATVNKVDGFYLEIAQSDGYRKTYVDVLKCEIVSYRKVTTPLGAVETATYGSFGKLNAEYWAVPYNAAVVEGNVTVGDKTYSSFVQLSRPYEVSFGGNTTFGNQGTTTAGALLEYDFDNALKDTSFSYNNVKVSVTFKSARDIVIAGYYGKAVSKTSVTTATGEWQTVELLLAKEKLAGLAFVSVNTANYYSIASDICIAAIGVEAQPAAPKVTDLKIAKDGKVTFTSQEGYAYNILNGNGDVLVENAESGTSTVTIADGANEIVIRTIDPSGKYGDTDSDALVVYKSKFGLAVPYTVGGINAVTSYAVETVNNKETLKIDSGATTGGNFGAEILLAEPIVSVSDKISYVKVTFKTPINYNRLNLMTIGINSSASYLAYYAYGNYDEGWVTAYMQLPVNTTVNSVYFKFMQFNSNRNGWINVASIELEAFDTQIETDLGNLTVASQEKFGSDVDAWAVPYHVSEDKEQSVTVNDTQYTGVVKLTDEEYSFGSTGQAHVNPGSFNTGALLSYTTDSTDAQMTLKIAIKISKDSHIAIAGYYGSTVDRTTYFVGTGEWQEIEITVNTANLQGITFVSINQLDSPIPSASQHYPTIPSVVEIAGISVVNS